MKKFTPVIALTFLFLLQAVSSLQAGTPVYNMHSGTLTTCNADFYDSGGPFGNYAANEQDTVTFFPAVSGNMIVLNFDYGNYIAYGDTMFIYDGPDATYPVLFGPEGNNGLPLEINANNPTGALTVYFHNPYVGTVYGWHALVSCVDPFAITPCPALSIPYYGQTVAGASMDSLRWSASPGAIGYDIYFGSTSPPPLVSTDQAGTTWYTGSLSYPDTFYYRIVVKGNAGNDSCAEVAFYTQPYCEPTTVYGTLGRYIDGVQFGSISNLATGAPNSSVSYHDYTSLGSSDMAVCGTYDITVTSGDQSDFFNAYVDADGDGVFDFGSGINLAPHSSGIISISIPIGTSLGLKRMRVSCGSTYDCFSLTGEAEDYLVNIVADTIHVAPVVDFISENYAGCGGDFIQFTDKSCHNPTSWHWYFPGGNPSSSTLQNPAIEYDSAGEYDVALVANNSYGSDSVNYQLFIYVNTDKINLGNDTLICGAGSFTLHAPGTFDYYTWSTGETSQNITVNSSGTYFVEGVYCTPQLVQGVGGCQAQCIQHDTIHVILDQPSVNISGDTTICNGSQTVLYSDTGFTSYQWSTGATTQFVIVSPLLSTQYIVSIADSLGCTSSDSITVVVNSAIAAIASVSSDVCLYDTISLNGNYSGGTSPVSYYWVNYSGFSSTQQNEIRIATSMNDSGLYILSVTDTNGCNNSDTVLVSVHTLPVATAGSNSPVCDGQVIHLVSSPAVSYSWIGPNGFTSTIQNPNINATLADSGIYTVTVSNSFGCTASASTHVNVGTSPPATATNSGPYCNGDTIFLSASGGGTYQWTGPNGFSDTSANPILLNADSTTMAGVYYANVSLSGCSASSNTFVEVNINPTVVASSNSPICTSDSLALHAEQTGGYDSNLFTWTGPNGLVGNFYNEVIHSVTLADNGNYVVEMTDLNGCIGSDTVAVVIDSVITPSIHIYPDDTVAACTGETVQFTSVVSNGGAAPSYLWYLDNTGSGFNSTFSVYFSNADTVQVYVLMNSSAACANPVTAFSNTVTVIANQTPPNPVLSALGDSVISTVTDSFYTYYWLQNGVIYDTTNSGIHLCNGSANYSLLLERNGCFSDTSNEISNICMGVDDVFSENNFANVYPNPSNGDFILELKGNFASDCRLEIWNSLGSMMSKVEIKNRSTSIHLPATFSSGVYLMRITADEKTVVQKLVIEK